jgi:hypothetical protein
MKRSGDDEATASADFRAHAYSMSWRITVATLLTLSAVSLPAILLGVLLATDPPITPPILVRLVAVFAVVPGFAAWLIQRALAAEVDLRGAELVVRRRGVTLEIPCASIARVTPWTVPLPGPGFSLSMRSGRRLRWGLQDADPTPLLLALAEAGGVEAARSATQHPNLVYANVKRSVVRRWRWYHLAGKFVLLALGPTAVLFNAHQHIAYGGFLGEYYLLGLRSYLETFGIYWTTVTIYLVLYASVWRGMAEGVALVTAHVAPSRAARVRRAVETACRVVYYAGVPVLLGIRFLP